MVLMRFMPKIRLFRMRSRRLILKTPMRFITYNGMYYMILEDRQDVKGVLEGTHTDKPRPGGMRPGLIYQSKDGIDWGRPKVGYQTNEIYFGHELARSERPHILWKDGKPDYLYLACHDDDSTAGYILKIDDWEGE